MTKCQSAKWLAANFVVREYSDNRSEYGEYSTGKTGEVSELYTFIRFESVNCS